MCLRTEGAVETPKTVISVPEALLGYVYVCRCPCLLDDMSRAPRFSVPSGLVEDRRITPAGIGKYTLVSGLSMSFRGTQYIVLASFAAPNDHYPGGNPQEMTIAWCPGVPEDSCA